MEEPPTLMRIEELFGHAVQFRVASIDTLWLGYCLIYQRRKRMASFRCADIGMDCQCELICDTQPELARMITSHIHDMHQADPLSPAMLLKIKYAIRE